MMVIMRENFLLKGNFKEGGVTGSGVVLRTGSGTVCCCGGCCSVSDECVVKLRKCGFDIISQVPPT